MTKQMQSSANKERADKYANWLIANKDQKGTEKFEKVKTAYIAARKDMEKDDGFSVETMAKNVVPSTIEQVKGAVNIVKNPGMVFDYGRQLMSGVNQYGMEHAKGDGVLADVAKAGYSINPVAAALQYYAKGEDHKPVVDAAIQDVKDRHGSLDKTLQTLESDPAGWFVDLTTAGTSAAAGGLAGIQGASSVIPRQVPRNMLTDALRFAPSVDPKTNRS